MEGQHHPIPSHYRDPDPKIGHTVTILLTPEVIPEDAEPFLTLTTSDIRVGATVNAVKGGVVHQTTIVRVTRWTITTADWKTWWFHQPDHRIGESVNNPLDRLLIH